MSKRTMHVRPADPSSGRDVERWDREARMWHEQYYAVGPVPADGREHPYGKPCPACDTRTVVEATPLFVDEMALAAQIGERGAEACAAGGYDDPVDVLKALAQEWARLDKTVRSLGDAPEPWSIHGYVIHSVVPLFSGTVALSGLSGYIVAGVHERHRQAMNAWVKTLADETWSHARYFHADQFGGNLHSALGMAIVNGYVRAQVHELPWEQIAADPRHRQ